MCVCVCAVSINGLASSQCTFIISHQCQLLTLVASALSSTIQRGSPSPHLAMFSPSCRPVTLCAESRSVCRRLSRCTLFLEASSCCWLYGAVLLRLSSGCRSCWKRKYVTAGEVKKNTPFVFLRNNGSALWSSIYGNKENVLKQRRVEEVFRYYK